MKEGKSLKREKVNGEQERKRETEREKEKLYSENRFVSLFSFTKISFVHNNNNLNGIIYGIQNTHTDTHKMVSESESERERENEKSSLYNVVCFFFYSNSIVPDKC